MEFTYKMPTEIFFAEGAINRTGEKAKAMGATKAFIVADHGIVKAGIVEKVIESLTKNGIDHLVFSDFDHDPSTRSLINATELFRTEGCDITIGVGGGSSMDIAKAVAALRDNPGHPFEYAGLHKLKNPKSCPNISIPTTAGTGSEVSFWSIFIDENDFKTGIGGWELMPDLAILDPCVTVNLPVKVTVATGMDALTHAIESYTNRVTFPITEALAHHAIQLIAKSFRQAVACGADIKARGDMLLASCMATMAWNITRLGLVHAMSAPFGGHFGIPHGVANAILLPHVIEYNLIGNIDKFTEIAKIFGEKTEGLAPMEAATKSVDAIKRLMRDIGCTQGLADWGVTEDALQAMAEEGYLSGNIVLNPRTSTVEDLIAIARKAMYGLE